MANGIMLLMFPLRHLSRPHLARALGLLNRTEQPGRSFSLTEHLCFQKIKDVFCFFALGAFDDDVSLWEKYSDDGAALEI